VRLFIQSAAEEDILRQFEWYAERGLYDIARRFRAAVSEAIKALTAMPAAGSPRHLENPRLAGLRSWPVKGFAEFQVYYLAQPELLTIIRILHSKRDTGTILEGQELENPDPH
jgi:toxin ParE1/3/4